MYRFAPSLTEDIDLEDLRVALFNFLCAKQNNARFIVRMEDGDKENIIEGKDQEILDLLALFGITYDELYYQSHNLKFHRQFAMHMMTQGKAFSCFCSDEIVETKKERAAMEGSTYHYDGTCEKLDDFDVLNNESPFVIRLKKPDQARDFTDNLQGEQRFEPERIDSFVIMNHQKYPTYNFGCATDDMLQGITHVIRQEKYMADTPRQELIREYLGYDQKIHYTHLPTTHNTSHKISNVTALLDQGFLPTAIVNYLLLLGNQTPTEIFTLEDALMWFDITALSTEPVTFDMEKLKQINREHIKLMDAMTLSTLVGFADEGIGKLAKLYADDNATIVEIKSKIDAIFATKEVPEAFATSFAEIKKAAQQAPYCETFDAYYTYLMEHTNLTGDALSQPLQLLLTGAHTGPEIKDLYPLLKNYLKEILR